VAEGQGHPLVKIMNIQLPTKYANLSDDDSSELGYMEQL
jgi:hypothetical protein